MESGPVCRHSNRPRMLICYLCGREYGSKSLNIHIPQCQKKWLIEEEQKPKNERRPLPPQPNADKALGSGGNARAFDHFNVEAYAAFEQTLEQCPYCQRRFLPKPFKTHQKACTALKPAKPAGTGLIKYSLTNRLVPGAVAGSMHGKAKKPPIPLRLCRPPPKAKPKMKSTQRPAWTGAGGGSPFDEMDETGSQLPITVRPNCKPSAQEWCLQAETNFSSSKRGQSSHKTRLPESRNSFNRNGVVGSAGGDTTTQLVTTFGDIWRTHRGDMNLPSKPHKNNNNNIKTSGAAKEWSIPTTLESSSSSPYYDGGGRSSSRHTKPGFSASQNNAVRSSSSHMVSERALHFVKSLPPSKQATASSHQSRQSSIRDHHRRSPGF